MARGMKGKCDVRDVEAGDRCSRVRPNLDFGARGQAQCDVPRRMIAELTQSRAAALRR